MRSPIAILTLLLTPLVHAATFRFDPPVPTNATPTTLNFTEVQTIGCPNVRPEVTVSGSKIVLALKQPDLVCPPTVLPLNVTVNLGTLPAGVYDLTAVVPGDPPHVYGTTRLVVRDVTTFTIFQPVGPTFGGTLLPIVSATPFDPEPIHVFVGGIEATQVARRDANSVLVSTPPHAAGPVDVVVDSVNGDHRVATAAFTYYDPHAATPDPFVFTPLLFPIDFAGPGAFGSQWTTENALESAGPKTTLPITGSPAGVVVPVLRTLPAYANSRIRDVSRGTESAGTEIPVVREDAFGQRLRLLNIPTGKNLRAQLRIWTSGEPVEKVSLTIDQLPTLIGGFANILIPVQPGAGGLRYGTVDLTPYLDPGHDRLDISAGIPGPAALLWGMVTVTNNDTQQVTVISPQ